MNADTHDMLAKAIEARFLHHVADTDIPPDAIPQWSAVLTQFVDDCMAKFAAGQREHGGDLRTRDVRNEIKQEIRDLIWYSLAADIAVPTEPDMHL